MDKPLPSPRDVEPGPGMLSVVDPGPPFDIATLQDAGGSLDDAFAFQTAFGKWLQAQGWQIPFSVGPFGVYREGDEYVLRLEARSKTPQPPLTP